MGENSINGFNLPLPVLLVWKEDGEDRRYQKLFKQISPPKWSPATLSHRTNQEANVNLKNTMNLSGCAF